MRRHARGHFDQLDHALTHVQTLGTVDFVEQAEAGVGPVRGPCLNVSIGAILNENFVSDRAHRAHHVSQHRTVFQPVERRKVALGRTGQNATDGSARSGTFRNSHHSLSLLRNHGVLSLCRLGSHDLSDFEIDITSEISEFK